MTELERTQLVTLARDIDFVSENRAHCLEVVGSLEASQRYVVGPDGVRIGRTAPCDIVLPDSGISRAHCALSIANNHLIVTDLGSTNGTFVEGDRVQGSVELPVGGILQIGSHVFRHEWRTRGEIAKAEEGDRELQRAASYVQALLPPPITEGPIRANWTYLPSARLGGDAFGYGTLPDGKFVAYLIDVAGHGAGAAMHGVAVMNQLRQRSLPGADMAEPGQVLATLNALFQMEEHAGLYFTIWYGVFDPASRTICFANGGHHPAYLVPIDRSEAMPLKVRGGMIGAMPGLSYRTGTIDVPPGASLYLFSDGVFEIVTTDEQEWSLDDFLPLLTAPPELDKGEAQRLLESVSRKARPGGFDDDFSLVVFEFD